MNSIKKKFVTWRERLDDPDDVGGSEYRAIHEILTDGISLADTDDPFSLANGILSEFIDCAEAMKKTLAAAQPYTQKQSVSAIHQRIGRNKRKEKHV